MLLYLGVYCVRSFYFGFNLQMKWVSPAYEAEAASTMGLSHYRISDLLMSLFFNSPRAHLISSSCARCLKRRWSCMLGQVRGKETVTMFYVRKP